MLPPSPYKIFALCPGFPHSGSCRTGPHPAPEACSCPAPGNTRNEMTAHGARPFAERNLTGHCRAMQVKPGENGFRLGPLRHMVAGEIGEALVVAQHHAAM